MQSDRMPARIMLLNVDRLPRVNRNLDRLKAKIRTRAIGIQEPENEQAAMDQIEASPPDAIIVLDSFIIRPVPSELSVRVVEYMKTGGKVIFGYLPMQTLVADRLSDFFAQQFDLPWQVSTNEAEQFRILLNARGNFHRLHTGHLRPAFYLRGLMLKNVDLESALYLAWPIGTGLGNDDAEIARRRSLTAVAWTQVGEGMFGYVGDVRSTGEEETDQIILTMCGMHV